MSSLHALMFESTMKSAPVRIQKKPRQLNLSTLKQNTNSSCSEISSNDEQSTQHLAQQDTNNFLSSSVGNQVDNENNKCQIWQFKEPEKILQLFEVSVNNGNFDSALINQICTYLKANGKVLDASGHKASMNSLFSALLLIYQDNNRIDTFSKTNLLEIIKLRATCWNWNGFMDNEKHNSLSNTFSDSNNIFTSLPSPSPPFNPLSSLQSSETIKQVSEKCFSKSTKVAEKICLENETSIRDADLEKANFEAKNKFDFLIGQNEPSNDDKTQCSTKNAVKKYSSSSLGRQVKSSQSSSFKVKKDSLNSSNKNFCKYGNSFKNHYTMTLPYMHSLSIGDELIIISSSSLGLVKEVKMVLDDHFNKNGFYGLEPNKNWFSTSVTSRNTQNTFWNSSKIKTLPYFDSYSEAKNKDLKECIPQAFTNRNILYWTKKTKEFTSEATRPKITYDRSVLFNISKSEMANLLSYELQQVLQKFPEIYRKSNKEFTEAI